MGLHLSAGPCNVDIAPDKSRNFRMFQDWTWWPRSQAAPELVVHN